jgi:hypothetical protein
MPGGVGGVLGRWLQVHTSILHQHAGNREVLVRVVSSAFGSGVGPGGVGGSPTVVVGGTIRLISGSGYSSAGLWRESRWRRNSPSDVVFEILFGFCRSGRGESEAYRVSEAGIVRNSLLYETREVVAVPNSRSRGGV